MNKYYLDGVLVVEGKSDVSYLSSFISTLYFVTNGYDISQEKIDFLSRVSEVKRIVVLTDNDEAGKSIEEKIKSKIKGIFVVKSRKNTRNSYKKSGVAETEKSAIIDALRDFLQEDKGHLIKADYHLNTIISLSEDPNEMKNKILTEYRLIKGNIKFLENQLQMLGVNPEEIIKKYGNK